MSFKALSLSILICGTGCSSSGSGDSSIVGSWECVGGNVDGSDGASWDPSEEEIGVEEDGDDYVLTGWSECQPEIDLMASGDSEGIDIGSQDCDTTLGYIEIRSMSLELSGDGASFSGDILSVVTEPVSIEASFDWYSIPCSRL